MVLVIFFFYGLGNEFDANHKKISSDKSMHTYTQTACSFLTPTYYLLPREFVKITLFHVFRELRGCDFSELKGF